MSKVNANGLLIGIVAGEESGQLLAADLVDALQTRLDAPVRLVGVGGASLTERGLQSLFDPQEIALMGVSARTPALSGRIGPCADRLYAVLPAGVATSHMAMINCLRGGRRWVRGPA